MQMVKKIVFVLPNFYSGGAERALLTYANKLRCEGFHVEVVVFKCKGDLKNWLNEEVILHDFSTANMMICFVKLLFFLRRSRPAFVFTTMVHMNFLIMLTRPFFPNIQYIIREAVVPSSILKKHRKKSWLIRVLYKNLYPLASYVVVPTRDIKEEFKTILDLNTDHVRIVYNQVDLEKLDVFTSGCQQKNNNRNTVFFVCVGRLTHQKGYDRLLRALAYNAKSSFSYQLDILGAGEDRFKLEGLVQELGLSNRVFFHGNVENPWYYVKQADCMLLPSRWEGMPNVVLEALACGCPVIASKEANGVEEIQNELRDRTAVQVANDMKDFVRLMEVIPLQKDHITAELPECFSTPYVMKQIQSLL